MTLADGTVTRATLATTAQAGSRPRARSRLPGLRAARSRRSDGRAQALPGRVNHGTRLRYCWRCGVARMGFMTASCAAGWTWVAADGCRAQAGGGGLGGGGVLGGVRASGPGGGRGWVARGGGGVWGEGGGLQHLVRLGATVRAGNLSRHGLWSINRIPSVKAAATRLRFSRGR